MEPDAMAVSALEAGNALAEVLLTLWPDADADYFSTILGAAAVMIRRKFMRGARGATMPALETMDRTEKAVYWAAGPPNDFGARRVYAPVELEVRWEDRKGEIVKPSGEVSGYDASVIFDRSVAVGSILWYGALEDWTASATGYYEVLGFDRVKDLKGRANRMEARLARYKDSLPEVVS
jgi:hypothetical protein